MTPPGVAAGTAALTTLLAANEQAFSLGLSLRPAWNHSAPACQHSKSR